jgi:hypothetical protein
VNGDQGTPCIDFDHDYNPDIAVMLREQLFTLAVIPEESRNTVNYKKWFRSPEFRVSPVFYIAAGPQAGRRFLPLPCNSTVYRYFHHSLSEHETNLRRESRIENQVELFMELSDIQEGDVVSVGIDATTMNPAWQPSPVTICS